MITGKLYLARNMEQAQKLMALNFMILYVGEANVPDIFFRMSILLPPIDAVNLEIEGDMNSFAGMYTQHLLFNEGCIATMATILVALHNGANLCLFVEGDGLPHVDFLCQHITSTYGIVVGTEQFPSAYNPAYNPVVAAILYGYQDGFIRYYELVATLPEIGAVELLSQPYIQALGVLEKLGKELNADDAWMLQAKIIKMKEEQHRFCCNPNPLIIIGGMPDVSGLNQ